MAREIVARSRIGPYLVCGTCGCTVAWQVMEPRHWVSISADDPPACQPCGHRSVMRYTEREDGPHPRGDVMAREQREIEELIRRSSLGDDAWIDCPTHGRQATDPFEKERVCVMCAALGVPLGKRGGYGNSLG